MKPTTKPYNPRPGFSAIELVVFVLMAGLLAAVATPKVIDKISDTRRNATMKSLGEIRDAIAHYQSDSAENLYPEDIVVAFSELYPEAEFPIAHVHPGFSNAVTYVTSDPIRAHDVTDDGGWLYNTHTGEVRINDVNFVIW